MSAQQTTGHMKAAYQEDHQAELTYAHHSKEHTEQGQLPVLDHKITFPPESDTLPELLHHIQAWGWALK